jgi:hypothetical protein
MVRHTASLSNQHWLINSTGTWAGGFWSDRTTVVPNLYTLISDDENPMEVSLDGVGTGGDIGNWILGGMSTRQIHCS